MDIPQILQHIGLEEKEASVYLALLELGTATVHPIATKANIKRPTTYLILEQLTRKGLVSVVPREKKMMYTAESPEKIISDLSKKQELVKRFMPNMMALYNAKKDKPQVLMFEGKDGVGQVYEKIFNSSEVDFFSTIRDVFQMFPDMPKWLKDRVDKKQTKFREILTQTPDDLRYLTNIEQGEYYQSRLAPKDFPEFLTDSAIFGTSVAFFSFEPQVFAVMITSRQISQSLRVLFELAWKAGEPYSRGKFVKA
jgi:HTH-type transcriptional regulator, sugar sensing transcriptional regulator